MTFLIADITWQPFFGARWGPAISAAHLLGAWLCWRTATSHVTKSSLGNEPAARSFSRFWLLLTLIMFGLSLNKLFDLQSLLTISSRAMAKENGWYRHRHSLQAALVLSALIAGFVGLFLSFRVLRGRWRERSLAYFSVAFLLTLVTIRVASYSPVDKILYGLPTMGNRMNASLELSASLLVSLAALLAFRPPQTGHKTIQPDENNLKH